MNLHGFEQTEQHVFFNVNTSNEYEQRSNNHLLHAIITVVSHRSIILNMSTLPLDEITVTTVLNLKHENCPPSIQTTISLTFNIVHRVYL